MSIGYTLGIPASGDNPSTDQPIMQANNDANPAIWLIDHIGFNASGLDKSGLHKQVTFNNNNIPAVPTAPPVLFTDTVAGLPQLKFFSGDAAHSSSQYVFGAADSTNGSTFLLGGMILKWGSNSANNPGNAITFAGDGSNAFPNHCFAVVITSTNASYTGGFAATAVTKTGFTATRTSGAGNTGIYYVAIGN